MTQQNLTLSEISDSILALGLDTVLEVRTDIEYPSVVFVEVARSGSELNRVISLINYRTEKVVFARTRIFNVLNKIAVFEKTINKDSINFSEFLEFLDRLQQACGKDVDFFKHVLLVAASMEYDSEIDDTVLKLDEMKKLYNYGSTPYETFMFFTVEFQNILKELGVNTKSEEPYIVLKHKFLLKGLVAN